MPTPTEITRDAVRKLDLSKPEIKAVLDALTYDEKAWRTRMTEDLVDAMETFLSFDSPSGLMVLVSQIIEKARQDDLESNDGE